MAFGSISRENPLVGCNQGVEADQQRPIYLGDV